MSADNMVRQVAVNRLQGVGCELRDLHRLPSVMAHAFSIHDESVARILRAGELWEVELCHTEFQKRHANRPM